MGDIGNAEQIHQVQFAQDLSVAALDETTSFGFDFKLVAIYWSFSAPVTEELSVETVLASSGDAKIGKQVVNAVSNATFYPENEPEALFESGDELKVGCTNVGGAGTVTVTIVVADR